MNGLLDGTLLAASVALDRRDVSPVELAMLALERIHQHEPELNAYAAVLDDRALAAASRAQKEIGRGGRRSPLHGIPVAVKDLIDMAGLPTTCSSQVRAGHVAGLDADCVERLERAGAVIVGKTHLHEFAYGPITPTTSNPWNTDHIPGGSSGGSGTTVAARGCFMAMGTDTGGSIRIPAALCGVVGLKPTFGRVSRFGIVPLSWSLDHAGPLTRSAADAAAALQVLAGHDPRDPGSSSASVPDYLAGINDGVRGMRIGVPSNFYFDLLEPEVEATVRAAIDDLRAEGAEIVNVELPMIDVLMAVEYGLLMPEASAFHRDTLRTHSDLYADDVRALLEAGELVPATDYVAAMRTRGSIQTAWKQMFVTQRLDAVVAPTSPIVAPPRGLPSVVWPDGTEESVIDSLIRFSAAANVTGLPSVAVPCGFSTSGLPTSFQIIGRPFDEAGILRIAATYEQRSDTMFRRPSLLPHD